MANLTDQRGVNQPLMFREIIQASIATTDYDPLAVAAASRTSAQKGAIDRGFCVRPNASGNVIVRAITWNAYLQNGKQLTIAAGGKADLVPTTLYAIGNVWEMIPLIKIYANDDGSYASGCTLVNIGLL